MRDIARALVYTGVFAIPFIPLIVVNSLFFPFITGKNFTFRIIVEIIFASWVILAFYDASYRPKFSWILGTFSAFIAIILLADILSVYPYKSFWSNYERMEGFVTLAHVYIYFVVLGSVLITDKLWKRFWFTSLCSAILMTFYGLAQVAGTISIRQSTDRIDGLLGNSAYLSMYMMFHVFIAAFYLFETKNTKVRAFFVALIGLFLFIMLETQTRGTALGLVVGAIITSVYIILFGAKESPTLRKVFIGVFLATIVFAGSAYALRDTAIVQSSYGLHRITHTSFSDLSIRLQIWTMAMNGVKERPILGWGQDGFHTVFNKYYDPALWGQEAWFDRVHNIVMDWLIASGIVGAVAYFSILGTSIYYLGIRPLRVKDDTSFTVIERGLLIGLLVGYLVHNFFVFDNIVSYIFYATILAFIHTRLATPMPVVNAWKIDPRVVDQVAVPIIGVALVATVYFVNVPGIQASSDIIHAFSTKDPSTMLKEFDLALSRGSFADQEIREQMTRQVQSIAGSKDVPEEVKKRARDRVEEELLKQIEETPGDARVHVFISSFYRMTGQVDKAIEQLDIARKLSPKKQQIIFEQGLAQLQKQDFAKAVVFFKEAYDLAPDYPDARVYYAVGAIYAGQLGIVDEVINTDSLKSTFANNDLAVQAAYTAKMYDLLKEMFTRRVEENPTDTQVRVNLAFILNESGDTQGAVEVLTQAGKDIPSFAAQSEQFIASLLAGKVPGKNEEPQAKVGGKPVEVKKP